MLCNPTHVCLKESSTVCKRVYSQMCVCARMQLAYFPPYLTKCFNAQHPFTCQRPKYSISLPFRKIRSKAQNPHNGFCTQNRGIVCISPPSLCLSVGTACLPATSWELSGKVSCAGRKEATHSPVSQPFLPSCAFLTKHREVTYWDCDFHNFMANMASSRYSPVYSPKVAFPQSASLGMYGSAFPWGKFGGDLWR